MKLSHGFGLLAAGLGSVGLIVFAGTQTGCGSSSGNGSGSGSGGASGGDLCANLPAGQCDPPPPAPSGAAMTSHPGKHNYALSKLYLGDTTRGDQPDPNAWKAFGYNLDDKITTAASTDVCKLVAGSAKSVQVDGTGGIDNSFGANIMPIIGSLDSTAAMQLNSAIQAGSFTILTDVDGFDDTAGNKTNATGLTGVLLAAGKYSQDGGAFPGFALTTDWPVLPDPGLISGCSSTMGCPAGTDPYASAVIKFASAYQTGGTFVNGAPNPLTLSLSIGGQQLSLNIASAVISFAPGGTGSVTNGTIAGVLDTMDLINGLMNVAGNISTSLCSGTAFQSIATQIEQTSDILLNGTTVTNTSGTTCNAISIGLGFESTEIAQPDQTAPGSQPAPSKCADAGTE